MAKKSQENLRTEGPENPVIGWTIALRAGDPDAAKALRDYYASFIAANARSPEHWTDRFLAVSEAIERLATNDEPLERADRYLRNAILRAAKDVYRDESEWHALEPFVDVADPAHGGLCGAARDDISAGDALARDVIDLLIEGFSLARIAERLDIKIHEVRAIKDRLRDTA